MKRHMILIFALCLAASSVRAQDTTAVCPHGQIRQVCECGCQPSPVNDYPGLNSLRARLANPGWDGTLPNIGTGMKLEGGRIKPLRSFPDQQEPESPVTSSGSYVGQNSVLENPFLEEMGRGEVPVGAPVYVFFSLAGTRFTDPSQAVNVNAAADLAVAWDLRVRITGAADSATGSVEKNAELAKARAEYVMGLLKERGVGAGMIEIRSEGGTNKFSPGAANRNCRIELYSK